jgi:hypothetical protein
MKVGGAPFRNNNMPERHETKTETSSCMVR